MEYPILNSTDTSREMIEVFGGYNHNLRINDGEFYDENNLTSTHYPLLAPRTHRGSYGVYDPETEGITNGKLRGKPLGLLEKDALCYVYKSGTNLHFVMNEYDYDLGMTPIDETEKRQLISMGAYVVIMPDKLYINTIEAADKVDSKDEIEDMGNIEATATTSGDVTLEICKADGTSYVNPDETIYKSPATPENPTDKFIWLDTSSEPPSLKQYSATNGMWSSIATTYVKISCAGIGKAFNQYDGVEISGIKDYTDLNTNAVIWAKGDDYIVVIGILGTDKIVQTEAVTVTRKMPTMDFIVESNNRLWGCRYGPQGDAIVNELYACKLGDFKNWNCFMGISTDSYYVSLGTDGEFTGAISYLGMPTFFKEDCIHTVYGDYPANYRVQDIACRGVQRHSDKSLAMVNEVLYYKSRNGICAYSGSLPAEISSVLGEITYTEAVGCSHKNKYYVSMKDTSTGKFDMFVFDTDKGIWHKEKDFEVKEFCSVDDEIYYISSDGESIGTLFGSGIKDETPIKWMAETGILGCSSPDKKYISRISVRLAMELGSKVVFSIQYDSTGEWETVCTCVGHNLRTFTLPIRPKRCDHFRLRIDGTGNAKIFSICKTLEQGSEL